MPAEQYVVPKFLIRARVRNVGTEFDAMVLASQIDSLRPRLLQLSDEELRALLKHVNFTDLIGLVISPPYDTVLQRRLGNLLFPQFISQVFLQTCDQCGERLLKPEIAGGVFTRVDLLLTEKEISAPTSEQRAQPNRDAVAAGETFLTDEEVVALVGDDNEEIENKETLACGNSTDNVSSPIPTSDDDLRLLARFVKDMDNESIRRLLVELKFYLHEDMLVNFLWLMKDGNLIRKLMQNMSQKSGRLFMDTLNIRWFGKNPNQASFEDRQVGRTGVIDVLDHIRRSEARAECLKRIRSTR